MRTTIRTVSLPVEIRHPLIGRRPRNVAGDQKFVKLWGFLFYTFNLGNPNDFDSISCSRFQKGYNYALLDAALRDRITARGGNPDDEIKYYTAQSGGSESPTGQYVQILKKAALDLGSMFHVLVLGHAPPLEHVQYIKSVSRVGTRVMTGLHNVESVNHSVEYNSILEPERLISWSYPIDAKSNSGCNNDGKNAYGCTTVDKYEYADDCSGWYTVASSSVATGGSGYAVNDQITLAGGTFTTAAVLKVTSISGGAVTGVTVQTAGAYTVKPSSPVSQASTTGGGTGATFNPSWASPNYSLSYCSPTACGVGGVKYATGKVACPHTPAHASLPEIATIGGTHTIDCDISDSGYHSDLIAAVLDRFETYYLSGAAHVLDGALFDNHLNYPYKGFASVNYQDNWATLYIQGWKDFDLAVATAIAGEGHIPSTDWWYWANCTDSLTTYSAGNIKNRWNETYFVASDGSSRRAWSGTGGIQQGIQNAKAAGLRVAMGITGTHAAQQYWATTAAGFDPVADGSWAQIVNEISTQDAWDTMYVQAVRQTSGGYGFWQEGFTPFA